MIRLSPLGVPRGYNTFVAKTEAAVIAVANKGSGLTEEEFERLERQLLREQKRIRRIQMIRRDDDEIMVLL